MQLKTILKRVQKFKSFVYESVRWVEDAGEPTIEAELRPRENARAICSGCGHRRPGPCAIHCRSAASSLSRCGVFRYFSSMPRAR